MPSEQELNSVLSSYGVSASGMNFSFANIMAWVIFGIIGWYAASYGWKNKSYKPLIIGVGLMIYPYFISNTILLYVIGVVLSSLLYFWRD